MSLSRIAQELELFFAPLYVAAYSPFNMSEFLRELGYDVDLSAASGAMTEVADLGQALETLDQLFGALSDAMRDGTLSAADQAQLLAAGKSVYGSIDDIAGFIGAVTTHHPDPAVFAREVFDRLLDRYLSTRIPFAFGLSNALTVRQTKQIFADDPGGRDNDYVQITYDWTRLARFIKDTKGWADEAYGFGRDFEHVQAILALADLVDTIGGSAFVTVLSEDVEARWVSNPPLVPAMNPASPPLSKPTTAAALPLIVEVVDDGGGQGGVNIGGEAGIFAAPFGDFAKGDALGLVFAPYLSGAVAAERKVGDEWTISADIDAKAVGGAALTLRPDGVDVVDGAAVNAAVLLTAARANADGTPIVLLGEAEQTRIEAGRLFASVGANLDGDLFAAVGAGGFRAVIDTGGDGFLSKAVPEPITAEISDVLMGVRPGSGVYFEGGTELSLHVPLDVDLKVFKLLGLELGLNFEDAYLDTTVEGEVSLGPLYAYAKGIGLRTRLVEGEGALGPFDLDMSFLPPTDYAVALDIAPVAGGGMISRRDDEYRGALALSFDPIGFSAFAVLNTRMPDGSDGFSMAASLFGEFNLPLGFGFFLTGLGGVLGINRTMDTDAMRRVLYEGRFGNLLFPDDPIANAATILDDMATIFPAREGQHLLGPVARLAWGQPVLIEATLGIILEVGENINTVILGGLNSAIPTKDAAIITLNVDFFGEINFAAQTLSFDATISNSRVLVYAISGGMAVRSGWAPRIGHVVSFGGLHPLFPKPATLPGLQRITVGFGTNNPRVTLTGYAALTLNTVQFGARAEIYAEGPNFWPVGQLAAEGSVFFDALIQFNPFGFDVHLGGGLTLLRDGNEIVGLSFDLRLMGPNQFRIDGRVWVRAFKQDIDFQINHQWGQATALPPPTARAVDVLLAALKEADVDAGLGERRSGLLVFRPEKDSTLLDPYGGASLAQTAVPLGIEIEKIGEANNIGPKTLGLALRRADGSAFPVTSPVKRDFVRGHFFKMTDAQKLRGPAFDTLEAGVSFSDGAVETSVDHVQSASLDYEPIRIPIERESRAPAESAGGSPGEIGFVQRFHPDRLLDQLEQAERVIAEIDRIEKIAIAGLGFTTQPEIEAVIGAGTTGPAGLQAASIAGSLAGAEATLRVRQDQVTPETLETVGVGPRGPMDRQGGVSAYIAGAML